MTFSLARHTIFLALAGSQAHGTAREGSDVDLRGVCIAPLRTRISLVEGFEQYEGALPDDLVQSVLPRLRAHPTASLGLSVKIEGTVFEIAKLLRLLIAANPNALEILFADERDWVLETSPWRALHDQRYLFLTRKVRETFLRYALAQLKRIKTHRSWLLDPPAQKPMRSHFGLPEDSGTLDRDAQNRIEQAIAQKVRDYGVDALELPKPVRIALVTRIRELQMDLLDSTSDEIDARLRAVATHALGLAPELVATLNAERRYRGAMKHWESYQTWKRQRNPVRAELERRYGYDTKHAMHLVRLMRMGLEALEDGELLVRRPDAEELAAIREGALSFDELLEEAKRLEGRIDDAAARTKLPEDVDVARVDALLLDLVSAATSRADRS